MAPFPPDLGNLIKPAAQSAATIAPVPNTNYEPRPALAFLAVIAGWIIPGGGYFLIGQINRGLTVCVTVLFLFTGGLAIGGIRVIDVPGYKNGYQNRIDEYGRLVSPGDPTFVNA